MGRKKLFTYRQTDPAHLKCTLNLEALYPVLRERQQFKKKLKPFLHSDPYNKKVYEVKDDKLIFESEQLVPSGKDDHPALLLVFGNPATHSVVEGMFFSPHNDGTDNRFWKHLLPWAGIVDLSFDKNLSIKQMNILRRKRMANLDYDSPFRVGLCVYFSMPSSAGGPWSGVAGIKKLLGTRALRDLERFERDRILHVAKNFFTGRGFVVTFQRNAWEGLRSYKDPAYSIDIARKGKLKGKLRDLPNIPLYGVPPTRLIGPCREILKRFTMKSD
jgi:hypothetical protein